MWETNKPTAKLVTRDGIIIEGAGFGAQGIVAAEICFNTAISGYQEILTDPSYAGQIVTFTFPHIGNVGVNADDIETSNTATPQTAAGLIIREEITEPANYRAAQHLNDWLAANNIIGIAGVDTRALTTHIREHGMFDAVLAHNKAGEFDEAAMQNALNNFGGLGGKDLAGEVSVAENYNWQQGLWQKGATDTFTKPKTKHKIVALDFGIKKNILRCLASAGCEVLVLPATTSAADILAHQPDGIFLSNGPGDPAATAKQITPTLKTLIESNTPIFGICLGHQLLALALGAKTEKMKQGHHGANHPVQDLTTNKVEIVSMNHGFAVARNSLPPHVQETHISLFDKTNCGLAVRDKPIFSVQYHPEAAPGPQDSHYLFDRFTRLIEENK